jgi:hypothetical protein
VENFKKQTLLKKRKQIKKYYIKLKKNVNKIEDKLNENKKNKQFQKTGYKWNRTQKN